MRDEIIELALTIGLRHVRQINQSTAALTKTDAEIVEKYFRLASASGAGTSDELDKLTDEELREIIEGGDNVDNT